MRSLPTAGLRSVRTRADHPKRDIRIDVAAAECIEIVSPFRAIAVNLHRGIVSVNISYQMENQ